MVIAVQLVPLVQQATKAPPAPPVLTVHKEHEAQPAQPARLVQLAVSVPMAQLDSGVQLVQPATREILGQLESPAKLVKLVHAETRVPWAKVVRRGLMVKLVKRDSEAQLAQLAQPDQRVQMVFKAWLGSKDTLAKTRALAPQVPRANKEQLVLLETQVLLALKAPMELMGLMDREVLSEHAAIRARKVLQVPKEPRVP
jgi:hypothetical protein